jgi:putative membrane protein
MHFLRTLFWVILAVVAVIFSVRNWTPVTIHLWGGIDADVKLPVMLFVAFAVGLLPMFVIHRATRWRMRRRLESTERALALAAVPPVIIEEASVVTPSAPSPPAASL